MPHTRPAHLILGAIMIKIPSDHWLITFATDDKPWKRPKDVCTLFWMLLTQTIIHILIIALILFLAVGVIVAAFFPLGVIWYTHFSGHTTTPEDFFFFIPMCGISSFVWIASTQVLIENRIIKNKWLTYQLHVPEEAKPKPVIWPFIVALYKRVKEKSCTLIEYK